MSSRLVFGFFVTVAFSASALAQSIKVQGQLSRTQAVKRPILVEADGSGDYPTLQAALDAAKDGDEILAGPGLYAGDGNRDLDFRGKAVRLASKEGAKSTTIDCGGSPTDPHRGIFFHQGEGPSSILEGFTIRSGFIPTDWGGAILCDGASPTLQKNRFLWNTGGVGGGIGCRNASPLIVENELSGNDAGSGGAFGSSGGSPTLVRNRIHDNHASQGGGISTSGWGNLFAFENVILGNSGYSGGGIRLLDTTALVQGNIISGNHCGNDGGGIYVGSSAIDLRQNTISDNDAAVFGGGVYLLYAKQPSSFQENFFSGNRAQHSGGAIMFHLGGAAFDFLQNRFVGNSALFDGGAIYGPFSRIENCLFAKNSADRGGAIYGGFPATGFANNTLVENHAVSRGGAIDMTNSGMAITPSIQNSIFWFNTAPVGSSIAVVLGGPTLAISYSDIQGGWPGPGNLDLDPLFVDMANGEYGLSSPSPCIDAADGNIAPSHDIAANPRYDSTLILNTGIGSPDFADIGSFERQTD